MHFVFRYIGKGVNSMVPTAYMHISTLIISLPLMACNVTGPVNAKHSIPVLISYTVVCVAGFVGQLIQSRGFQIGPPAKTTTLLMTHTLLSGLIGVIFFSESVSWLTGFGAAVIVISAILVTVAHSEDSAVEE